MRYLAVKEASFVCSNRLKKLSLNDMKTHPACWTERILLVLCINTSTTLGLCIDDKLFKIQCIMRRWCYFRTGAQPVLLSEVNRQSISKSTFDLFVRPRVFAAQAWMTYSVNSSGGCGFPGNAFSRRPHQLEQIDSVLPNGHLTTAVRAVAGINADNMGETTHHSARSGWRWIIWWLPTGEIRLTGNLTAGVLCPTYNITDSLYENEAGQNRVGENYKKAHLSLSIISILKTALPCKRLSIV